MPEALVVGDFGWQNPGGEAVLEAVMGALDTWDFVAASSDPSHTRSQHACRAIPDWKPRTMARCAAAADAVILAGEPLLGRAQTSEPITAPFKKNLIPALSAAGTGKPFAMLGVGAGALRTRRRVRLARALAGRADLLVLGEESTADLLIGAGLRPPFRVGADPAWALLDTPPERTEPRDEVLVVIDASTAGTGAIEFLRRALAPAASEGVRVAIQAWGPRAERAGGTAAAEALAQRLTGTVHIVDAPADLVAARDAICRCRFVIASGVHSLAAAASAGVPAFAMTYETEVAGLARRLAQPFLHLPADPADLTRHVLSGNSPAASRAAVQERVAAAEEGFRLLRLLLSKGRSEETDEITGLPLVPQGWTNAGRDRRLLGKRRRAW